MSKKLEKELFNIYDVIVFEDKNGIAQDCVCVIGKDKEVDEIVDMIECNNHSISIYENGSYKVWEKDGKNKPYYATNKKIIHLYTLKNDNRFYEIYPTNDYESIDNAEPSEALECLKHIKKYYIPEPCSAKTYDCLETIKQALLKAQEPKKYLKWEDLEFDNNAQVKKYLKVKLGDNIYSAFYYYSFFMDCEMFCIARDTLSLYITDKQFFNDLHLERVEE